MKWSDKAREAANEVLEACRNPPSLIAHLAPLVSREKRPGVICDTWSYRNRLIVLLRGYSEARGNKRHDEKNKTPGKKAGDKKADREQKKVLIGYRAVPVFGLEQTEPAEDGKEDERYQPSGQSKATVRVFNGYKQPWYQWYEQLRYGNLLDDVGRSCRTVASEKRISGVSIGSCCLRECL